MRDNPPLGSFALVRRAVATLLLSAGVLHSQRLRGTVRDSASGSAIPGAVLVLLDANGNSLGRNITNERGEYVIALQNAIRRMQVLRIGFRPRTVPIPEMLTGTTELNVVMASIPTLLDPVKVVDQPNCARRDDRAAAFALWEQAKAALLATVVARESGKATVTRLHYERRLDNDDRIVTQSVRIDSASTARPFTASRAAEEFVDQGFAYDSARVTWFNGPDADVMLDDAFARGYCFSIADADRTRPHEIGLGFAPAKRKRDRVDIEGAVWIDSASRVLTDIVFRYVGLPARAERVRAGGAIAFRAMVDGTVMIDRWSLRFPVSGTLAAERRATGLFALRLLEARESGGEVAHVTWPDGREWQASLGKVRGQVVGNGGAGSLIQLVETQYGATVDSAGAFEISNLLPGPYDVGVIDPTLAGLGLLLKTGSHFTAVRDSTTRLTVDVPSALDYIAAKCDSRAENAASGVLVIRVLRPDGAPAEGAHAEVAVIVGGELQRVVEGNTDRDGLFHLCRLPRNARLSIIASAGAARSARKTVETTEKLTAVRLQLVLPQS